MFSYEQLGINNNNPIVSLDPMGSHLTTSR
nr:MAG TPA: hypothetical protein [Caudoviricetes sp.]